MKVHRLAPGSPWCLALVLRNRTPGTVVTKHLGLPLCVKGKPGSWLLLCRCKNKGPAFRQLIAEGQEIQHQHAERHPKPHGPNSIGVRLVQQTPRSARGLTELGKQVCRLALSPPLCSAFSQGPRILFLLLFFCPRKTRLKMLPL